MGKTLSIKRTNTLAAAGAALALSFSAALAPPAKAEAVFNERTQRWEFSSTSSSQPQANQSLPGEIPESTLQWMGFLGGGPAGVWLSPWVYRAMNGNTIGWLAVGVIGGGFLWQGQFIAAVFIYKALQDDT